LQPTAAVRRPVGRFYEIGLSGLHLGVTLSGGWLSLNVRHKKSCEPSINKRMKTLMIVACCMSIFAFGCSKPHKSDSITLQGTWSGQEMGVKGTESPSLVIRGSNLEFHGANSNEWYKATFSLREDTNPKQLVAVITECPFRQYVGKTENAIYQIQNGTLTLTGNEPGNPAMPMGFDAPSARKIVFKQK
jgi:uncharacterized protein (TIGR03067 family)